jgi:hypothetical protein
VSTQTDLSHSVYFEGSWCSEDQERISGAVAEFESTYAGDGLFPASPVWVCVAYDVGSSTLFCAHRPHLPSVLSAHSVRELATSIRTAP